MAKKILIADNNPTLEWGLKHLLKILYPNSIIEEAFDSINPHLRTK